MTAYRVRPKESNPHYFRFVGRRIVSVEQADDFGTVGVPAQHFAPWDFIVTYDGGCPSHEVLPPPLFEQVYEVEA